MSWWETMKESHESGERISAIIEGIAQLVNEDPDLSKKDKKKILTHLWPAQDAAKKIEDDV